MKNHMKLSAVAAGILLGLAGCSSSSSDDVVSGVSGTDVTVERGPIMEAIVSDAVGQVATVKNKNVYNFADPITYPVSVRGGWIDVNGNGERDLPLDVDLDMVMKSFLPVVTPLTTMAANDGDVNASNFEEKLQKVADQGGLSLADAKKLPSQSYSVAVIANAIYAYDHNGAAPLDSDSNLSEALGNLADQNITSAEELEEWLVQQLIDDGDITAPSGEDVQEAIDRQAISITPTKLTLQAGDYTDEYNGFGDYEGEIATLRYSTDLNVTSIRQSDGEDVLSGGEDRGEDIFDNGDYNLTTKTIELEIYNTNVSSRYHNTDIEFTLDDNRSVRINVPVEINPKTEYLDDYIKIYDGMGEQHVIHLKSDGTGVYKNGYDYLRSAVSYNINDNNLTLTRDTNSSYHVTFSFPQAGAIYEDDNVSVNMNGEDIVGGEDGYVSYTEYDRVLGPRDGNDLTNLYYPVTFRYDDSNTEVFAQYRFNEPDVNCGEDGGIEGPPKFLAPPMEGGVYTCDANGTFNVVETTMDTTVISDYNGTYSVHYEYDYNTESYIENTLIVTKSDDNTTKEFEFNKGYNHQVNDNFDVLENNTTTRVHKLVEVDMD